MACSRRSMSSALSPIVLSPYERRRERNSVREMSDLRIFTLGTGPAVGGRGWLGAALGAAAIPLFASLAIQNAEVFCRLISACSRTLCSSSSSARRMARSASSSACSEASSADSPSIGEEPTAEASAASRASNSSSSRSCASMFAFIRAFFCDQKESCSRLRTSICVSSAAAHAIVWRRRAAVRASGAAGAKLSAARARSIV
mmetsp:Transcript_23939/g.50806  ORF Transcript_23939/g.50806 Transcript_23939/m.50806 type:complete len:202 (+) Transcript_23939:527-1132(+)